MDADTDDILAAHEHSVRHRDEIEASVRCGCFHCCKVFRPTAIVAWIRNGASRRTDTARCPHCSIDAVFGSASGLPVTTEFLERMRRHWFRH